MESSYFDRIGLERKCLAWLVFGVISGGWRGTWSGLAGRARIWACLAMCQCISVSVYPCVSVWPPAYLAGVRSNLSVTVSACYSSR